MLTSEDKRQLRTILSNLDNKDDLLDVIEESLDSFYENVNDGTGLYSIVRNEFPDVSDILDKLTVYYNDEDILDAYDDDTKLENIKNSWTLDDYVKEHVEEETSSIFAQHQQDIEDILNAETKEKTYLDMNPDDVYIKICDFLGVSCYYNHDEIEERVGDMLEKMSHSCYGQ